MCKTTWQLHLPQVHIEQNEIRLGTLCREGELVANRHRLLHSLCELAKIIPSCPDELNFRIERGQSPHALTTSEPAFCEPQTLLTLVNPRILLLRLWQLVPDPPSALCPLLSDICPMRAGAAWLLKRAQLARELLLDLPGDSAELKATLKALLEVPAGFTSLNSLAFRAPNRTEGAQEAVIMVVLWLVGHAKGLVFLSIDRVSLPYLPSLAHIRHLQLAVSVENFWSLAPVLATLVTLQTLYLDGSEMQEPAAPPAHLDLQALTQLETVMLDAVVPASLLLPEGTALHAIACCLEDARNALWPTVLGALKSFVLETDEQVKLEEDIPGWMLEPVKLDRLVLSSYSFGVGYDPEDGFNDGLIRLRGALLLADEFCLYCSEGLYVEVPKEHQWRLANLISDNRLFVRLRDIARFASCPALVIRYRSLEGIDLSRLASYLAKSGIDFDLNQWGEQCEFRAGSGADILHEYNARSCKCGACRICCRLDNFQLGGERFCSCADFWEYN